MKALTTFKYLKYAVILIIAAIIISGIGVSVPAYAEGAKYTSAIEDLQKDEKFSAWDYPINDKDYSVQVIQIAESKSGKLYVYVYNPSAGSKPMTATKINMTVTGNINDTQLYPLTDIAHSGVFGKYLVKGVTVSNAAVRIYNITSIYRNFNPEVDKDTGNNNELNSKAYAVGKTFKATTINGEVEYSCEETETIEIINPYSDYLIYSKQLSTNFYPGIAAALDKFEIIDSHYIAFSTDRLIEQLLSATLHYHYRTANGTYNTFWGFDCGGNVDYGADEEKTLTLKYTDKAEVSGNVFGKKYKYSWERIQTVSDFISTEKNLTDETKKNIRDKEWILRFTETERTQNHTDILGYETYKTDFTKVDRVTILRLEFETDGVVYNLGAVSDEVSGDEYSGNSPKNEGFNFWVWLWNCLIKLFTGKANVWETIVAVILIILVIVVLVLIIKLLRWVWRGLRGDKK